MRKKIILFLIIAFLATIGYLASLSDPPLDESRKNVDIDRYLTKKEMNNDIDTLIFIFEKIHPNPYRFTKKNHFISKTDTIKRELPDSLSTINFWRIVDQIIVQYNDAHSKAEERYVLTDYIKKDKLFFPMSATIQTGRIHVTENERFEQLLPGGTEIIKINGRTNIEITGDLLKHAAKETQSLKIHEVSDDFGYYLWKAYNWNSEFKILYKSNNGLDSITVKGIKWEKRKKSFPEESEAFSFTFLNDSVGYMKITDFNGGEKEMVNFYRESFKRLKKNNSPCLILDFRGHTGGADSYGEHLAKHFAKEPYRKLSKAYWKITPEFKEAFDRRYVPKGIRWFKPLYLVNEYSRVFYGAKPNELKTVSYALKNPLPEEERFHGDVYLITDHNTFSAGSIFTEMFTYYNMGTVIGQPTGNLYSFNGFAMAKFTLPNSKLSFQVSSVYNVANNKEEGLKSVEPDYYIDSKENPVKYILDNFIR